MLQRGSILCLTRRNITQINKWPGVSMHFSQAWGEREGGGGKGDILGAVTVSRRRRAEMSTNQKKKKLQSRCGLGRAQQFIARLLHRYLGSASTCFMSACCQPLSDARVERLKGPRWHNIDLTTVSSHSGSVSCHWSPQRWDRSILNCCFHTPHQKDTRNYGSLWCHRGYLYLNHICRNTQSLVLALLPETALLWPGKKLLVKNLHPNVVFFPHGFAFAWCLRN